MTEKLRLDIPVLLPGLPDSSDPCVERLLSELRGKEGVEAAQKLFKDYDKLPYRLYAFAPGKKTSIEATEAILKMDPVIGLGELGHLTYSVGNDDDFRKAAMGRVKGGPMNSHWGVTALSDMMLNYLPAIGSSFNHDVWTEDDIERSIRYGFPTQIKFGVGSPEVIKIMLRAIVKRKWPTENFLLCSDNISVKRLQTLGHMDWVVSQCAEMGINPIHAIKMATLYTARLYHMDTQFGSLTPGKFADVVLTDSLSKIDPRYVFKDGELVAKNRQLVKHADIDYSGMVKPPVPGLADLAPQQLDLTPLEVSADGKQAKVYLFDVYGRGHEKFFQEVWVPYENGQVVPRLGGVELNRIAVVQRYAKGQRHIVNGLFKGVSIARGPVAGRRQDRRLHRHREPAGQGDADAGHLRRDRQHHAVRAHRCHARHRCRARGTGQPQRGRAGGQQAADAVHLAASLRLHALSAGARSTTSDERRAHRP